MDRSPIITPPLPPGAIPNLPGAVPTPPGMGPGMAAAVGPRGPSSLGSLMNGMGMPPGSSAPGMMPPGMGPMGPGGPGMPPVDPMLAGPVPLPGRGMPPMLGSQMSPLIDLLNLLDAPGQAGPQREPWQEPPKPDETTMLNKARADQSAYGDLLARFERHLRFFDPETPEVGVNPNFDPDSEQFWVSSMLRDEEELAAGTIGTADVTYLAEARTSADRDEAEMKESFLYYLRREAIRQYSRQQGGGSRQIAEVKNAFRYGRLISRNTIMPNVRPGACPFSQVLMNPATVFPTWDGLGDNGLETVTRVYIQSVRKTLAEHGDGKGAEKKLLHNADSQTAKNLTLDSDVEVIEYWDRKWYAVFAAGILIKGPVAHDYGEVPFIYTLMELGEASNTDAPARSKAGTSKRRPSRNETLARQGQSAIAGRIVTHTQREAMLGRLFTSFLTADNPATIEIQAIGNDGEPATELSAGEGARNTLPPGHDLKPFPKTDLPATTQVLLSASGEDMSRSSKSPAAYGLTPSQTTGFAIEGMVESSKHKDAPIIDCIQRHLAECGEQCLREFADFGHLLGDDGNRGRLRVPYQQPGQDSDPTFELTPDIIKRTGVAVEVELSVLRIQSLNVMLNALSMAQQKGWITRDQAIRMAKLPGYRNPWRTMQEIDIEGLKEMPQYKLAHLVKYAFEVERDPALAELILRQMLTGGVPGGGPGGMPPPPGPGGPAGPGGPPPPNPAQTPGMSLPGLGQPPGPGTGAPQGPRTLQPISPDIGALAR